ITAWENGSLNRLFTKLRDTMPPFNAEQVTPGTKIDIIAYLLQVNGFPSGSTELAVDVSTLEGIQIVRKGADGGGAPNFALVQVLVAWTKTPNGGWILTSSWEPAATKDESTTPDALKSAQASPLGTATFELVSVSPSFGAESHRGHKMEARG